MSGTTKWWVRTPKPKAEDEPTPAPSLDVRKADLVAEAERRGLDTSGTKADLIERLSEPETDG